MFGLLQDIRDVGVSNAHVIRLDQRESTTEKEVPIELDFLYNRFRHRRYSIDLTQE